MLEKSTGVHWQWCTKCLLLIMDMVLGMHMMTCLAVLLQVLQLGTLIRTKQITSVELTSVFQQRLKM